MSKVIVCDDEQDIRNAIGIYLKAEGYEVLQAADGKEAIHLVETEPVDLLILDQMMPVMDGLTALNKIREFSNIPVIILTAKSEDTDKVLGLSVGADEYVTKPFNPVVLMAIVKSILRRYKQLGGSTEVASEEGIIELGNLRVDDQAKEAQLDGEPLNLTRTEYDILKFLMLHAGQVFSPTEIYSKVWNEAPLGGESTVAVHIRHLREKIEIDPSNPRYLKVVWGRGYKLEK